MKPLLRVLAGEALDPPPVWLMRQAGRYLPEYRAVRAEAGSFLDLCYNPELACEVTLQPIRRFAFDAAILFSDILVIPHALGRDVRYVENEGPKLDPLTTFPEVEALDVGALHTRLDPVYRTVERVKAHLPPATALIGFAGAPWTLACYMVEGQGSKDFLKTRLLALQEPELFRRLTSVLETVIVDYLDRQIQAGADAVMLFDTWAGLLPADGFEQWCLAPAKRIVEALKARHPSLPVIAFPRGAGVNYVRFTERVPVDGLGLDTALPTDWAASTLPLRPALQGHLDPALLVAGGEAMDAAVERMRTAFKGRPYIFNLGHGVVPQTDPQHVQRLVSRLRDRG